MTDRRLTPATDRVALEALRGVLDRPAYTAGRRATLAVPVADLCPAPGALRDRQLNFGAMVTVIDEDDGWSFVQARADGYCGWLAPGTLAGGLPAATHRVHVSGTHVYAEPDIKRGEVMALSLGARLAVAGMEGRFARLATGGYVPAVHVSARPSDDSVAVAESLLGTPYLWGGNSRWGIDCSGLVQAALTACGTPCPGDSDLQWRGIGAEVPRDRIRRGDLIFWRGHVAMACSPDVLIHANGATMSVAHEGIAAALARIEATGEGAYLGVRRP